MENFNNEQFLEKMRKDKEKERQKKHEEYLTRGIPKNVVDILESGKLKSAQTEQILALPWETIKLKPIINVEYAQDLLDKEHVGLEDVKSRIMDYVYSDFRGGAALLLVGPPGVGKTSIAIQIAKAINRSWYEISLSGIASAHEITGVDPTFSEAAPGEIIRAVRNTGSFYPLIILDEIDKVGRSTEHGDPQNALLEVLDTNRTSFRDRFLSIPVDLSNFIFIATANNLSDISPILRDRLEVIEIGGYNRELKKKIFVEQVIPKIGNMIVENLERTLYIDESAVESIISKYAVAPGIRELYDIADRICRKANREYKVNHRKVIVSSNRLETYLGKPRRLEFEGDSIPVVGNANTSVLVSTKYAKIITVQTRILDGTGVTICTGGIEGLAEEAVKIAVSIIRYYSNDLGISFEYFSHRDIHVHSEYHPSIKSNRCISLAIFVAIISNIFKKRVNPRHLFAGELHLDGSIRYVKNIDEYLDAAIDSNLSTAYISRDNLSVDKDLLTRYEGQLKLVALSNIKDFFKIIKDGEKDVTL